jgi:DUF438 domain-containing protein
MAHGRIPFAHGSLAASELVAAFSAIPADITFVDAEGIVRYFSDYRIFSRPESCLDVHVLECHQPESRPGIERLLAELRDGWRDEAIFGEKKDGRPVHVRYLALRDAEGSYVGCMEIAQWGDEVGELA